MSGIIASQSYPIKFNAIEYDLRLTRQEDNWFPGIFFNATPIAPASFERGWWPGSGLMGADDGLSSMLYEMWSPYDPAAGAGSRYGFGGISRDQYGSALGGVTLRLFRTSDGLLVDTTVSDPQGNFLLVSHLYPDAHFIVAHKTGSPGVHGASVNTLIGV